MVESEQSHDKMKLSQAARRFAAFASVCTYVLAVLISIDDAAVVFNGEVTIVPIVNAKVQAAAFLACAPIFVVVVCQYFQSCLSQTVTELRVASPRRWEARSLFEDILLYQVAGPARAEEYSSYIAAYCVVWLLAPLTIAVCWFRSLVDHATSLSYYSIFSLTFLLLTSYKTWTRLHPRGKAGKFSEQFGLACALATMVLITAALAHRTPSVCFEPAVHDQNHTFFDRSIVDNDARCQRGIFYYMADLWTHLNLEQGPDLRRVTIGVGNQNKERVVPLVFPGLDLTNAQARGLVARPTAYLVDSILIGTDLNSADLYDANLNRSIIEMADLRLSNISKVGFIRAHIRYVDFSSAAIDGAYFRGSVIEHAEFDLASMKDVIFDCTTLIDARLGVKSFAGATFSNTRLINSWIPMDKLTNEQKSGICVEKSQNMTQGFTPCPAPTRWNEICRQDVGQ